MFTSPLENLTVEIVGGTVGLFVGDLGVSGGVVKMFHTPFNICIP